MTLKKLKRPKKGDIPNVHIIKCDSITVTDAALTLVDDSGVASQRLQEGEDELVLQDPPFVDSVIINTPQIVDSVTAPLAAS